MAEVTWSAARDNNDPISDYVVYYNSSHDDVTQLGARLNRQVLFAEWKPSMCISKYKLDSFSHAQGYS